MAQDPGPKTQDQALVLVSGGVDSAVALWWALRKGWSIEALSFDYHLRPQQEIAAVERLLQAAGISRHRRIPVPFMKELSDLRQDGLALEHLAGAPEAYMPARNMVFYALAAHFAEILGSGRIVGGHNAQDAADFPDAGPDFFGTFHQLCRIGVRSFARAPFEVVLPLVKMSKAGVVRLGQQLEAPLELTWSCYWDGPEPCGKCPSCLERKQAMHGTKWK